MRALASGKLGVDPVGTVLKSAEFPPSGERGGPAVKLTLANQTGVPLRLTVKLTAIAPALDDAVVVRGSAAGAVLIDGPLKDAADWSLPAGVLSAGETTTFRLRFKLKKGLSDDAYRGRIDIRQIEVDGVPIVTPSGTDEATPSATSPGASSAPTTPGGNASAAVLPAPTPSSGATTP